MSIWESEGIKLSKQEATWRAARIELDNPNYKARARYSRGYWVVEFQKVAHG